MNKIQIHGFASEGGFVSTANDYIGASSRGSLKLFEAGVNVSVEPLDRLRFALQLTGRNVGTVSEAVPRLDWAVIEYRFHAAIGARAGLIKIPLGLYNEYVDIDSARTAILMPQSVYPIRNRDALISHTGFAIYGTLPLAAVGELDYQVWLGTLTIPRSALELTGATLDSVDTKYAVGGQLFWRPGLDGLRLGGSVMQASIDFNVTLGSSTLSQLIAAGKLAANDTGRLVVSQKPTTFWVGSAEYMVGDWTFAVEYSRWLKHEVTSLPAIVATVDEDAERMYAMVTYRVAPPFELGTYYSLTYADVNDRNGRGPKFGERFQAFQRDLALSLRFDVNNHWLWKLEGHFIDGTAELQVTANPNPKRYWGLFLFRTTVSF